MRTAKECSSRRWRANRVSSARSSPRKPVEIRVSSFRCDCIIESCVTGYVLLDSAFLADRGGTANFRRNHSKQKRVGVRSYFVRKVWSFVKDSTNRTRLAAPRPYQRNLPAHGVRGSTNSTRSPPSWAFTALTLPPCIRTMRSVMAKPRPAPPVCAPLAFGTR